MASKLQLRLVATVNSSDDAIISKTTDGVITSWNAGAEKIFGYTADEAVGRSMLILFPPNRVAEEENFLERISRGESVKHFDTVRVRKDGGLVPVSVTLSPIIDADGNITGVSNIARDITERKHAEEELRKSEARLVLALSAARMGTFHLDLTTGAYIDISSELKEQLGFAPEHAICPADVARIRHPEDSDLMNEEIRRSLEDKADLNMEYRYIWPDGSVHWIASTGRAVYSDDGEPIGLIGVTRDVTERKLVEKQIRELNADLERRVQERTVQLEAANHELEAFSYSVSHDLRAPLRSIDGFSQALTEDCYDSLSDTGRDYLQRVRAASQHMAALIDDLLGLARVTRSDVLRETVDVSTLASVLCDELKAANPKREVETVIAQGLCADADARLLRIVLQNLLGNAWKYSAKHASAKIEVGQTEHNGENCIFVRDDGSGFNMAYADKLFAPFQRLHSPREFEGTGIGLATVQRILLRHGGKIYAESAVEQGATFFFTVSQAVCSK
jgi:PAS domain S-box-containing protein